MGRVKSSIMLKDDSGIVLKDTISTDMFAKFFQPVCSINDGILPNVDKKTKPCLSHIVFDENDINTRLRTLLIKYSCGPDEISTLFLQTLHNVLAFPLCSFFSIVLILLFYLIIGSLLIYSTCL